MTTFNAFLILLHSFEMMLIELQHRDILNIITFNFGRKRNEFLEKKVIVREVDVTTLLLKQISKHKKRRRTSRGNRIKFSLQPIHIHLVAYMMQFNNFSILFCRSIHFHSSLLFSSFVLSIIAHISRFLVRRKKLSLVKLQ